MLRCKKGDQAAVASLFEKHHQNIFRFCYRTLMDTSDAQKIVHETFVEMCNPSPQCNPNKKVSTLLYTIASNLCMKKLKTDKYVRLTKIAEGEGHFLAENLSTSSPLASEVELDRQETAQKVMRALKLLEPSLRIPLILSRYHGLTNHDICDIVGCNTSEVQVIIRNAQVFVAQKIKPHRDS
jgi:RNA polymerase sigma-70 factor (ECF subfamily)